MAGLSWKCAQCCWSIAFGSSSYCSSCVCSAGEVKWFVLLKVNHLWQICSADACALCCRLAQEQGRTFASFKTLIFFKELLPFHTLASGHYCFRITVSALSPSNFLFSPFPWLSVKSSELTFICQGTSGLKCSFSCLTAGGFSEKAKL